MPYTHFRLLAYEVPTATYVTSMKTNGASGWNPGRECPAAAKVPVNGVTNDDARIRLKRLASVVNSLSGLLPLLVDDDNSTLKIFMVPEFYFRPPRIDESYHSNTYPNSVKNQILTALNEMFAHASLQHWLFVCGTVLWNSREDVKSKPIYFNTAVSVKGGPHPDRYGRQDAIVSVIEKQLPSGIDGILGPAPGTDLSTKRVFQSWKLRKQRVFNVDGTNLGLEICLDHLNDDDCRVLKKVLADWPANSGNAAAPGVKLHLLPAGGMSIETNSVAADPGGYILRNDGIANPGARSQLKQVNFYGRGGGFSDEFDPDPDSYADLTNVPPEDSYDIDSEPTLLPMPDATYKSFPQRVAIYPAKAMPA